MFTVPPNPVVAVIPNPPKPLLAVVVVNPNPPKPLLAVVVVVVPKPPKPLLVIVVEVPNPPKPLLALAPNPPENKEPFAFALKILDEVVVVAGPKPAN